MSIQRQAAKPNYDESKIAHALAILDRDTKAWDAWFADAHIDPLRVYYEDLTADPLGVLNGIMRAFDLPPLAELPAVPTRKQASAVNAEWKRRYLAPVARFRRAARSAARRALGR